MYVKCKCKTERFDIITGCQVQKLLLFSAFVLRIVNLKKHNDNRKRTGRYDLGPLKHLATYNGVNDFLDKDG